MPKTFLETYKSEHQIPSDGKALLEAVREGCLNINACDNKIMEDFLRHMGIRVEMTRDDIIVCLSHRYCDSDLNDKEKMIIDATVLFCEQLKH